MAETAPADQSTALTTEQPPSIAHNAIYVAFVAGQGRGVFASRDIAAGEILYQEQPYVMVPLITKHGDKTCLHCVKQFPRPSAALLPTMQCERCHECYCSPECRRAYEKKHVECGECTALYRTLPMRGELSTDDFNNLRGIAAMVMRCKLEGKARYLDEQRPRRKMVRGKEGVELVLPKMAVCDPEKMDLDHPATDFTVVASLTTNISLMTEDQIETFQEVYEAYERCVEIQDEEDEEEEEDEEDDEDDEDETDEAELKRLKLDTERVSEENPLHNIPSRLSKLPYVSDWMFEKIAAAYQCNGFSIWNEHKKESSSGVYGFAAMINHSCVPNVVKTFTIKTLNFVAKKPIKRDDQLFISYVDTALASNLRQWRLSHQYYIERCACPKCQQCL